MKNFASFVPLRVLIRLTAGALFYLPLFLLFGPPGLAQDVPAEMLFELLEEQEETAAGQADFLEVLQDLESHPLDVNRARVNELLRIPFLNRSQAAGIVRERGNGRYKNIDDLRRVAGLSAELLAAIAPYLKFSSSRKIPLLDYRLQLARQLELSKGFFASGNDPPPYGNPLYLRQQLRITTGRLESRFIREKDAGEPQWNDLSTFYIRLTFGENGGSVLLGDMSLKAGLGLLMSSAYGTPAGSDGSAFFRGGGFRLRGKGDNDENSFLRGLALELQPFGNWRAAALLAATNLDAGINSGAVNSFPTAGLHRSDSELNKKDQVRENLRAAVALWQGKTLQAGMLWQQSKYSRPVALPIPGDTLGQFENISFFYDLRRAAFHLRGEYALHRRRYRALQQNILVQPAGNRRLHWGAIFYAYQPGYWSRLGRAFGSSSGGPSDAAGYFSWLQLPLGPLDINAALQQQRPLDRREDFPESRQTRQIQLRLNWQDLRWRLRYVQRVSGLMTAAAERRAGWQLQVEKSLSKKLRFRHGLSRSTASRPALQGKKGFAMFHDIRLRPWPALQLQARWSYFDVADFDLRLYEFENDLPGRFRNALFNDRGDRWYILLTLRGGKKFRWTTKYRQIGYPDLSSLGSGNDALEGNRRREIRSELRWTW